MPKTHNLQICHDVGNRYEIGIDEAGRGPLFGRLYVAACVLPKDTSFHHEWMCDSKKIHSRKKMKEIADYIKQNAVAWNIQFVEADVIDKINIRQSVLSAMHECAKQVIDQLRSAGQPATLTTPTHSGTLATPTHSGTLAQSEYMREIMLLVDGNDFTPHMVYNEVDQTIREIPFETIEGGDNTYTCIAAASILAKNERDTYMEELCKEHPLLNERYGLAKNMGYGTKIHREAIDTHGITQWHRKTYGMCKTARYSPI